jgi:hypothetical protein
MLPNPGSYRAQQNGTVIIRMEETGSLMAYIPYLLLNCAEVANYANVHNLTIGAKDGNPQTKNIATLKAVFPNWDELNLEDIAMPAEGEEIPQFDLADCFHDESYTPEGATEPLIQFKAKWFNQVGGGRKAPMTADERKVAVTKWKSKFKALSSAKPAAATTKTVAAPAAKTVAPTKAAVAGPPGRKTAGGQARTSTEEEVWNAVLEAKPEDVSEDILGEAYYTAMDEVKPNSKGKLTPVEWGQLAEKLEQGLAGYIETATAAEAE